MLLLQQMIVFFFIMAVGFLCCKIKALDIEASRKMSWIVVNVSNPALIIASGLSDSKLPKAELPLIGLVILVYYAFLILMAQLVPRIIRVKSDSLGTYKVMTILCNISFMGFPIISAMYGEGAVLYASLFCIPFNIIIYTYGIAAMRKPEDKTGNTENVSVESLMKKVLNIGTISSVIGLALYLLDLPVPVVVTKACSQLGSLTGPLSMMVIGIMLAGMNFKDLFTDVKLIIFSLVKLIVIPLCALPVMNMCIADPVIRGVTMVMIATPVATLTAMLSQQYDGDFETASKGVALSTILSVITMPIVFAIAF